MPDVQPNTTSPTSIEYSTHAIIRGYIQLGDRASRHKLLLLRAQRRAYIHEEGVTRTHKREVPQDTGRGKLIDKCSRWVVTRCEQLVTNIDLASFRPSGDAHLSSYSTNESEVNEKTHTMRIAANTNTLA